MKGTGSDRGTNGKGAFLPPFRQSGGTPGLLVVGSVALDSIETTWGKVSDVLGGSATYAALAARFWTQVGVVAVVGEDFPHLYWQLFSKLGLLGEGLQRVPGRTFRWQGRYGEDGQAHTLHLDLGVFQSFRPRLPKRFRSVRSAFLANIHPALQWSVLRQLTCKRLTACDSREDWIRSEREDLLKVMRHTDLVFLNDGEARLLTGISSLVQATRQLVRIGAKVAVVKKGEHGVLVATEDAFFSLPGYPVATVVDPTGAGDAFAGTCLGYLANQRRLTWANLCKAIQYASVVASMTIEDFGTTRLSGLTKAEIFRRARAFQSITHSIVLKRKTGLSG
jgi:sugar/nucleoside kinase (ribokinase family)